LINDLAAEGDTVVVAAAGNVGNSVRQYPAAESDKVLSVAATTAADTLASFSTFGSWVGIAAPGDGMTSTIPGVAMQPGAARRWPLGWSRVKSRSSARACHACAPGTC
jgi:subtilisin family serine protease